MVFRQISTSSVAWKAHTHSPLLDSGYEWPAQNPVKWLLPLESFSLKVIVRAQERNLIPPDMPTTPHSLLTLTAVSSFLYPANLAEWMSAAGFSWGLWLPYLSGAVVLAVGIVTVRNEFVQKRGLDRLVVLGPICLAVPLAVFGMDHFTATKIVAGMVPAWIPGHMFWALFVGTCLIAAALSIAARKYAWLASALVGVMILLFVFLIHIPGIAGNPHTRILWVVGLRDLSFAGGAFALAASLNEGWGLQARHRLATLALFFIAIPIAFLGVEQVLHPEFAPGVPLAKLTPLWVPAHLVWGYVTGAIFVVIGISLIIKKQVRLAATWLGLISLLLVLLIYLPIVIANPSDIGNGLNYLADTLLLSGSALALAGSQLQDAGSRP
jgi:uncharacterized membrane protein